MGKNPLLLFSFLAGLLLIPIAFTHAESMAFPNQSADFVTTPVGQDVEVAFGDSLVVTFDSVAVEGQTELVTLTSGPPLPLEFASLPLESDSRYYRMASSASYYDSIEICIAYDQDVFVGGETGLGILYLDDGRWRQVVMSVDTNQNMICGKARSLSTFVIGQSFMCGDANSDLSVDVSDAVYIINYVFAGGSIPLPLESAEVNCDTLIDVSDAVYLINFAFAGGNEPCHDCDDGIERIVITDQTGFDWDVTHAFWQYDLDPDNYNFGLGPYAFTPIINPVFLKPGDVGYPAPHETFRVIGTIVNGNSRAYRVQDLTSVETANDTITNEALLVAY
jgi:hypothetical protein